MPSDDSDRVDGLRIEPHFRYHDNDHNATVTERLRSLRRASVRGQYGLASGPGDFQSAEAH